MITVPNFNLSVGKPLSLEKIALNCSEYNENSILMVLKSAAKKHKISFGVEIFKLQYQVELDDILIIPGPVVGVVDCSYFKLTFEPKFSGISVGKCLAFAQVAGAIELVNHSETIVEEEVSYDALTTSVDYFSKAFLSSVYDVLKQGVIKSRQHITKVDPEIRGNIDFQSTISNASEFPTVQISEPTSDLDVNQYIKGAISTVLKEAKCTEIKGIAGELLNVFHEVSDYVPNINELSLSNSTTLHRKDYEKCLTLAQVIYDGFHYEGGEEDSFTPYFTINLDALFERLVSQQLEKQILPANFDVCSQLEIDHPVEPIMEGKRIKPDVVVIPKDNNKSFKNIIIDSKNKYSVSENSKLLVSNSDIYQITYYAQCFNTDYAILVYPGNNKNCSKYPIQSAEGRSSYEKKRQKAFDKIKSDSGTFSKLNFITHEVNIFYWRVDLTGTMKNTEQSFAQLALFITDLSKGELI
ncbi:5-methylcytosine restriction system specificity protein McrC [Colwellia sp. RSH04]|uniref:5-methylcytosine restriction system specificity protein McrC n=1 Tax=Colwellia sp. RSH04 TaxID=2305464 RepID=UPI000E56D26D|nr:hypothetical protein [Colwellia sp. RSH04]RHW77573.1 hypothetical protein D1094_01070 [Colwellia sp. RSH04]